MGTRQVRVEYTGATEFDIDEGAIVDDLGDNPTDEQVVAGIEADIAAYMEHGSNVQPVRHEHRYDRDRLIASVRAEIERRRAEEASDA